MTREEAVKILKECRETKLKYTFYTLNEYQAATDIAIKALEQEPCEDCISRQAAKKALEDRFMELQKRHSEDRYETNFCLNTILELPLVAPQQKIGHWIRWYEQKDYDWYVDNIPHCKCSECDTEYDPHSSQFIKYCNECGAKMQEVEE